MSNCCWFYLQRHFQNVPWIRFPSHHLHCAHDHSGYHHLQPGWFPRPPLPSDFCPCPQWSEWSCSDLNQIVDPLTAPHHPQRDISTFQSSSCVFMMRSLSLPWPHHLQSPLNQSIPDPVASGFYLAPPATPLPRASVLTLLLLKCFLQEPQGSLSYHSQIFAQMSVRSYLKLQPHPLPAFLMPLTGFYGFSSFLTLIAF